MSWRKILKPIRDRLRDNLPESPSQPLPTDQELQKRHDNTVRGFAYFETFAEVEAWRPDKIQLQQRANTPLLPRSRPYDGDGPTGVTDPKNVNLTLIHDYSGGYHSYESMWENEPDGRKQPYTCEYLNHVERFVYFSHKLVSIPPPSWTNLLHRSGVKVFGTLCIEPQTIDVVRLLSHTTGTALSGISSAPNASRYTFAASLSNMAQTYGFDGFLINIEKTFPVLRFSTAQLVAFLNQLRHDLGEGNVIWYDSLTVNNTVEYQNSLTSSNVPFIKAAGAGLINYAWTPGLLQRSTELLRGGDLRADQVSFGIDVWAQNERMPGQNERKTWPEDGGGGTGTGRAVAELAAHGFGAGIFAPAWAYEHFEGVATIAAVDRAMWRGTAVTKDVACSCSRKTIHVPEWYQRYPVTGSAKRWSSGSLGFFFTDFRGPFRHTDATGDDKESNVAHLVAQSVIPLVTYDLEREETILESKLVSSPPCLEVFLKPTALWPSQACSGVSRMRIYSLAMPDPKDLEAIVIFSKPRTPDSLSLAMSFDGAGVLWDFPRGEIADGKIVVPLHWADSTRERLSTPAQQISLEANDDSKSPDMDSEQRLDGISIVLGTTNPNFHLTHPSRDRQLLLTLKSICIRALSTSVPRVTISNFSRSAVMSEFTSLDNENKTCWLDWSIDTATRPLLQRQGRNTPWSTLTGPVAYFSIRFGSERCMRTYVTRILVDSALAMALESTPEKLVTVEAVGFDGEMLGDAAVAWCDVTRLVAE